MALHLTPADHDADPPSGWTVVKAGTRWDLRTASGAPLASYATKRAAEEGKVSGFFVELYEQEGRWFAGLPVPGWGKYRPAIKTGGA